MYCSERYMYLIILHLPYFFCPDALCYDHQIGHPLRQSSMLTSTEYCSPPVHVSQEDCRKVCAVLHGNSRITAGNQEVIRSRREKNSTEIKKTSVTMQSPFVAIWNAPTELCMRKFRIPIDVSLFETVGSTLPTATNQNITLFYTDRLGYYPYIDLATGISYNGGIPQMSNMERHLKKARKDILHYLPSATQNGLAIIDWEDWRPIWIRNWASKAIYKKHSTDFVLQKDLTLDQRRVESVAKLQFESAAKHFMLNTLRLGKQMRPHNLWGFYLFPNCQNYNYKQNPHVYTGQCPAIEMLRNDKLRWLWKESTALFPNMYLETALMSSQLGALYTRHRIQEAKRISRMYHSLPIYMYSRPVFTDQPEKYLTLPDLVNTIGESAALGANGFVVWGSVNLTRSMNMCMGLNDFIINTLNPYIINVSLSAKLCSAILCQNNGICTRKEWSKNTYLHLNGKNIVIEQYKSTYKVIGHPSFEDLKFYTENFKCHCYPGHKCKESSDPPKIEPMKVCLTQNICIKLNKELF
ncbi:hyaluronidase PH-20 isoform X2 [Hyla sarda]|uniref:hyaluronidase PH-20 isoform X2 n=1 Tax=Hyla sarda TaxID=327740 RepID=UPI0024C24429|nr:hyaluronidase PH-20 isoform X2 [Hyla sarda]